MRVDTQQADAILACDMVVGASADTLQTVRHGRTAIVANSHEIQTAAFVRNPDANLQSAALLEKMRYAAGDDQVSVMDAQALAEDLLGDTITSNILMMGFAWQRGLVPVSLESLHRAVELNGVAVEANKMAFAIGRLAAGAPSTLAELSGTPPKAVDDGESISLLIERRVEMLTEYQDAAYAVRYRRLVDETRRVEEKLVDNKSPLRLTMAVARNFAKLLAYKDEYEVARLYTNGEFVRQLNAQFDGDIQVKFHMAPPVLVHTDADGKPPTKLTLGPWMWPVLRLLARLKGLRGSAFDFFGRSEDRKLERQLIEDYANLMGRLLQRLTAENLGLVVDIASVPEKIRGYGHVKASSMRLAKAHEQELLERLS